VTHSPLTSSLAFALCLGVASAASAAPPTEKAAANQKLKTVVLGLEGRRGIDAGLAAALTDIVQGVYAREADRMVLGPSDLARVLGFEQTKQALGCDDESCLSEIASALDADRLVTGSLDRIGSSYLFVLSEIDARELTPIGRVEHQFPVEEEMLVSAVRQATVDFLARDDDTPPAPLLATPAVPATSASGTGTEGEAWEPVFSSSAPTTTATSSRWAPRPQRKIG